MRKILLPVIIFLIFSAYYAYQACPTFYFWDSAELTAAVIGDGVPHPTGFPLLLLLAKIWIAVTPLEKATGLNFFSAFFAGSGLVLWYLIAVRMQRRLFSRDDNVAASLTSLISVAVLGLSFTYAIQAVRFEVYSLNFFLFAAVLYLALKLIESHNDGKIRYAVFFAIIGLSLGAHILTAALVIPGILLLLYLNGKKDIRMLASGIAGSVIVAVPLYFTLFNMALSRPQLNWGDPSGFSRFLSYIFVEEFAVKSSSFNPGHLTDNLTFFIKLLIHQLGAIGMLLAAAGLTYIYLRRISLAIALTAILILNIFSSAFSVEFFYENLDLHGYHVISLGIASLCVAVALRLFHNLVRKRSAGKESRSDPAAVVLTIVVAVLAFIIPLKDNFLGADLSDVDGKEYAGLFLENAPPNSVVLTSYYNTYFCLMASDIAYHHDDSLSIQCIYNWDHRWGREQFARVIGKDLPLDADRQVFYRNSLNHLMRERPIYIEYDESSRPIVRYLVPEGLGYIFDAYDTLSARPDPVVEDIEKYLKIAGRSCQIEWIKTWTLWFSNRGLFYANRGDSASAQAYYQASESIASKAQLR